jgi:hypothetical protein
MTAVDLVLPVLAPVIAYIGFVAVALLGMAMLHMIGKSN